MVAIFIIVSTRGDLIRANDCPAAHVAAGVSVGVAINKTVGCNNDFTFSFADFATRGNKGNCLLSGQKTEPTEASHRHRQGYEGRASFTRQKGICYPKSVARPSQGIVYSLSWNFGSLRERTRERKTGGRTILQHYSLHCGD